MCASSHSSLVFICLLIISCLSPSFSFSSCIIIAGYTVIPHTCSLVTRVVVCRETATLIESVCDLHVFAKELLDMQCCVVSTCFTKEILGHATLLQPPHLVCGFPCFIGDFGIRDARTSTTGARSASPQLSNHSIESSVRLKSPNRKFNNI